MSKLRVLSPIGTVRTGASGLASRPRHLKGLRLGVLNNGKPNSEFALDRAASFLEGQFGVTRTVSRRKANTSLGADFLDEFAEACDIALIGVGD